MTKCNLDHTHEDVIHKFEAQRAFMPEDIVSDMKRFLEKPTHKQEKLNVLFHLLKKYDLASDEERNERNLKLIEELDE